MLGVNEYLLRYNEEIFQLFKDVSSEHQVAASQMYSLMKDIFEVGVEKCSFMVDNEEYFANDSNSPHMENIIEQFYKQKYPSAKFYFYRVKFAFEEIFQFIRFWIKSNPNLTISITNHTPHQQHHQQPQTSHQQPNIDNQFIKDHIKGNTVSQNSIQDTHQKHNEILENEIVENENVPLTHRQTLEDRVESLNTDGSITKRTNKKVTINIKSIFEFYSKQTHLTGVKATFGRIQQESNTINYQKLVHFLREYHLFPNQLKKQKDIYALYLELTNQSRNLNFEGFQKLLDRLPNVLIDKGTQEEKRNSINNIMINSRIKNKTDKMLNKPFHSQEKQDFRINSQQIKYQFKLHPINGMQSDQIINQLQMRKQSKQQAKQQQLKDKQIKKVRYLKKLQSIDPYSQLLLDNPLLKPKPVSHIPVASFDNIEQYRDTSFNIAKHFGLRDIDSDPIKDLQKSSIVDKKVKQIQSMEFEKMKSLMNGIIERTDAKIQKMGLSPNKSQKQ